MDSILLSIKLENLNRTNKKELYLNDRKRLATSTSANFINNDLIIIGSLVAMKLYLYKIDLVNETYNLMHEIDTTFKNEIVSTDLASHLDNVVIVSNFYKGSQTIYKIIDNKITHFKDIKQNIFKHRQFCHGVNFYNENIIMSTLIRIPYRIDFTDLEGNLIYHIKCGSEFKPKDVCNIKENKNRIIAFFTKSEIMEDITNMIEYSSRIKLFEIDLEKRNHKMINYIDIKNSHADCVRYYRGVIFLSNQLNDTIDILYLDNDKIKYVTKLNGFNMPHGFDIDINGELIAVSNYGDNTVKIKKIPANIKNMYN